MTKQTIAAWPTGAAPGYADVTVTDTSEPGTGIITMRLEGGADFRAYDAAEAWCRANDVAVGTMQRYSPIGLMRGRDANHIGKWSQLTRSEQQAMDGTLTTTGTFRNGPLVLAIRGAQ